MSVIKDISKKLGLSESTVKKIISDPFAFSDKTSREVLEMYNAACKKSSGDGITVGVIVPKRPIFFWKDVTSGISDAIKASGRSIRANFFYYSRDLGMTLQSRIGECDCYICYPSDTLEPQTKEMLKSRPCVLLNEESDDQGLPFIGPDGYDEGVKAAGLVKDVTHIAIVKFRGKMTVNKRIEGFTDTVKSRIPNVRITVIQLNNAQNIAAAMLAKRLAEAGYPDCVYVTTGASHVGGGAIYKLRERTDKRIVLIGHELAGADRRYLNDGSMLGCVVQDAYAQGYGSVELVLDLLDGKEAQSRYVASKVITASGEA
ncbi:MAG: LacI family DNA-binding transcriptional regulator [Clostridia bacterium]|nr:LacI family DNA-binding transcriptional regulator [Clostridia bacterium]